MKHYFIIIVLGIFTLNALFNTWIKITKGETFDSLLLSFVQFILGIIAIIFSL